MIRRSREGFCERTQSQPDPQKAVSESGVKRVRGTATGTASAADSLASIRRRRRRALTAEELARLCEALITHPDHVLVTSREECESRPSLLSRPDSGSEPALSCMSACHFGRAAVWHYGGVAKWPSPARSADHSSTPRCSSSAIASAAIAGPRSSIPERAWAAATLSSGGAKGGFPRRPLCRLPAGHGLRRHPRCRRRGQFCPRNPGTLRRDP